MRAGFGGTFITRNLDGAIRIGHRVVTMNKGEIFQASTSEGTLTGPADARTAANRATSRERLSKPGSTMTGPGRGRDDG